MTGSSVPGVKSQTRAARLRLGGVRLIALMAFLVPAIIFVAVVATVAAWESGRANELAAMERADKIVDRIDAELRREMASIQTVAASLSGVSITSPRPDPERQRINAVLFPQWAGSVVWRIGDNRAVFSSMPGEDLPDIPPDWAAQVGDAAGPVVGGVDRLAGQPIVALHQRVPGDARGLVLTIALKPEAFRDMLMAEVPEGAVAAVVDREGDFIGRSLNHDQRVGTPATRFVRDAIARGKEGTYRGRTYEGLDNVSAYATSELAGWSAHVAISDRLIDAPASRAILVAAAGGVLSLAAAGLLIWLVMQDARRRQQTELALAQAQRVESLGRLTGGIAHDFNNMLSVIIGGLERAKGQTGEQQARTLDAALGSARQAASLTRSLMLYSRQQPLAAQVVNLNDCVSETAEVMARTLGAAYEVKTELDPGAGAVKVDPAQLASALLNLAINSRDAMPAGGRVMLRTARRALAAGGPTGLAAGDYAEVSVTDSGEGMPPEVARRAFEPFFTTKDVGKGTGLGLSQVDGFARQSGGAVELQTAPGEGATVTLLFPRIADAAPAADAEAGRADTVRCLRVLLVEDNPALLEHAGALLRELGHEATAVGDVEAAERALQAGPFDLLFSDIVLPGATSGVALAERARQIQPGIAVVLTTGYARDELKGRADAYPIVLKPYSAADIAAAIAQATARAPAGKRILLVEDEALIALGAEASLAEAGHEVKTAGSVAQARDMFAPGAFDIAFVDIGLPDGSGLELAAMLHAQDPDLRVIIASGQSLGALPRWAELLPKPYAPEDIVKAAA